jgi:hypothetical protein
MALRWTGAGLLEAERQLRKIIGHRDLANLAVASERDSGHHAMCTSTRGADTLIPAPASPGGGARSAATGTSLPRPTTALTG